MPPTTESRSTLRHRDQETAAALAMLLGGTRYTPDDAAMAVKLWRLHADPRFHGLLTGVGFAWNPIKQNYVNKYSGNPITAKQLKDISLAFSDAVASNAENDPAKKKNRRGLLIGFYLVMAALAAGGFRRLIGKMVEHHRNAPSIDNSLIYLDRLEGKQEAGTAGSPAQIAARMKLYWAYGNSLFEEVKRRSHEEAKGYDGKRQTWLERNILGPNENHCHSNQNKPGCVELTALGWRPIGTIPPPGSRVCAVNCKCRTEYRAIDPDSPDAMFSADTNMRHPPMTFLGLQQRIQSQSPSFEAGWEEGKHPRDEDGRWTTLNGAEVFVHKGIVKAGPESTEKKPKRSPNHLIGRTEAEVEAHGKAAHETKQKPDYHRIERDAAGNYVGTHGPNGLTHDAEHAERLKNLKIPAGFTKIHLAHDPEAMRAAYKTDSKGRETRIYRAAHDEKQAAIKHARVKELAKQIESIRLKLSIDPSEEAAVLRLIDHTFIRPGSETDTGADEKAYGATTLRGEHVITTPEGKTAVHFIGKEGVLNHQEINDELLANDLKERAKHGGKLYNTTESKVRDKLDSIAPGALVKDLRTHGGTDTAIKAIKSMPAPINLAELVKARKAVSEIVSKRLGNNPAMALKAYIAPEVWAGWETKAANLEQAKLIEEHAKKSGLDIGAAAKDWIGKNAAEYRERFNKKLGKTSAKGSSNGNAKTVVHAKPAQSGNEGIHGIRELPGRTERGGSHADESGGGRGRIPAGLLFSADRMTPMAILKQRMASRRQSDFSDEQFAFWNSAKHPRGNIGRFATNIGPHRVTVHGGEIQDGHLAGKTVAEAHDVVADEHESEARRHHDIAERLNRVRDYRTANKYSARGNELADKATELRRAGARMRPVREPAMHFAAEENVHFRQINTTPGENGKNHGGTTVAISNTSGKIVGGVPPKVAEKLNSHITENRQQRVQKIMGNRQAKPSLWQRIFGKREAAVPSQAPAPSEPAPQPVEQPHGFLHDVGKGLKAAGAQAWDGVKDVGRGIDDAWLGAIGTPEEIVHGPLHVAKGVGEGLLGAGKILASPFTGVAAAMHHDEPRAGEVVHHPDHHEHLAARHHGAVAEYEKAMKEETDHAANAKNAGNDELHAKHTGLADEYLQKMGKHKSLGEEHETHAELAKREEAGKESTPAPADKSAESAESKPPESPKPKEEEKSASEPPKAPETPKPSAPAQSPRTPEDHDKQAKYHAAQSAKARKSGNDELSYHHNAQQAKHHEAARAMRDGAAPPAPSATKPPQPAAQPAPAAQPSPALSNATTAAPPQLNSYATRGAVKDFDNANLPMAARIDALADVDPEFLDEVSPKLRGLGARSFGSVNEYFRGLTNIAGEWNRGLKSPADQKKVDDNTKFMVDSFNSLSPALRTLAAQGKPELKNAADFYDHYGPKAINMIRENAGLPPISGPAPQSPVPPPASQSAAPASPSSKMDELKARMGAAKTPKAARRLPKKSSSG